MKDKFIQHFTGKIIAIVLSGKNAVGTLSMEHV